MIDQLVLGVELDEEGNEVGAGDQRDGEDDTSGTTGETGLPISLLGLAVLLTTGGLLLVIWLRRW